MKLKSTCLILVMAFSAEALANNFFIPNYYRNRRIVNQFSAIGFSDRSEASLALQNDESETKTGGVKDSKSNSIQRSTNVFHRYDNNVNLEAAYSEWRTESKDLSPLDKANSDSWASLLNAGYEMPTMPLAFGIRLSNINSDTKRASNPMTSKDKVHVLSVGTGYRLENQIFIGAGYANSLVDNDRGSKSTSHSYSLGGGKIWGDLKKADSAMELVYTVRNRGSYNSNELLARGLVNQDALQYHAELSHSRVEVGSPLVEDSKNTELKLGVDYQIAMFYVGPQIELSNDDAEKQDADEQQSNFSIEAGYRAANLEVFLRANQLGEKTDSKTGADSKEATEVYTLGASYFF